MERYGFFLSDPSKDCENFTYLHGTLFESIHECLRVARDWKSADHRYYFKILNNDEIIKYIHNQPNEKKFGYIFLCNDYLNDVFFTYSHSVKLYSDLLNCINDGKCHYNRKDDEVDYPQIKNNKIGYFVILNNDDLVNELHVHCKTF